MNKPERFSSSCSYKSVSAMAAAPVPGVEQVVELFQNQRYRKFKVSATGGSCCYLQPHEVPGVELGTLCISEKIVTATAACLKSSGGVEYICAQQ